MVITPIPCLFIHLSTMATLKPAMDMFTTAAVCSYTCLQWPPPSLQWTCLQELPWNTPPTVRKCGSAPCMPAKSVWVKPVWWTCCLNSMKSLSAESECDQSECMSLLWCRVCSDEESIRVCWWRHCEEFMGSCWWRLYSSLWRVCWWRTICNQFVMMKSLSATSLNAWIRKML